MRKHARTKKMSTPNHPMLAIAPHGVMSGPIEWKTKIERTAESSKTVKGKDVVLSG